MKSIKYYTILVEGKPNEYALRLRDAKQGADEYHRAFPRAKIQITENRTLENSRLAQNLKLAAKNVKLARKYGMG
jgi:hypothetical protein